MTSALLTTAALLFFVVAARRSPDAHRRSLYTRFLANRVAVVVGGAVALVDLAVSEADRSGVRGLLVAVLLFVLVAAVVDRLRPVRQVP